MKTGLIYSPIYLEHDTGSHPENAKRLEAVMAYLKKMGVLNRIGVFPPRKATVDEVALVHTKEYITSIENKAINGGGWLDMDTFLSPASFDVAMYAVGGVLTGIEKVMAGELSSAFALVRPPGHHAGISKASGFCIFNNVAVAARYALKEYKLQRVMIVDFDVHHGNGTSDIFYSDPAVLYFSTHQYPFYPGTGSISETGSGEATGNTVNIPLPAMSGDSIYNRVFEEILVPIGRRFRPQLILVSAGYDGHREDYLATMRLTVDGFVRMTATIKQLAGELCGDRMVFALEGGYATESLSECIKATLETMNGEVNIGELQVSKETDKEDADSVSIIQNARRLHGLA
ncbi:MAG: histone deacetylase [Dehalococcoidia bacterium]|nr:histone deacetylase [Dehalococcoidia bacterium]MDZ4247473.1 histone deacetylase [Dehalococcoidia bacterium]